VNGAGILNRWMKRTLAGADGSLDYEDMNELAAGVAPGCGGLVILPYGNGAERTLENRNLGASLHGLDLNLHNRAHLLRAAQEGIVFALAYGLEIMRDMGMRVETLRAGEANMFLSPLFREAFANVNGTLLELYDTDGAQGAARGAGLGAGIYASTAEAFTGLRLTREVEPDPVLREAYKEAYARWRRTLQDRLEGDMEVQHG
jgi:xylulokinase